MKTFDRTQLCAYVVSSMEFNSSQIGNDHIRNTLTNQLDTFLYQRTSDIQKITVYRKPQSFWDWIRRKNQSFLIEVKCSEVLKNPPKTDERFIYINEIKEQ